jgi:hypothetical protein
MQPHVDVVHPALTLFLQPRAILDGGRAVGDAFASQGIGALVELWMALYEYIDASQEEANPYAGGTVAHATFRYLLVRRLHRDDDWLEPPRRGRSEGRRPGPQGVHSPVKDLRRPRRPRRRVEGRAM